MLTEALNLLLTKVMESNTYWVESQRVTVERERLEIEQWRLELDEVEKKWRALVWEVEMEKRPGVLAKRRVDWMELVQEVEFIQGSSKDNGVRVKEVEELEDDEDEEIGSDGEGGEAELQAEMGVTLPPSQPPV